MSVSSLPEKIDSEYSAHILQEMLENDNLREIELVAELDDKRFRVHRLVMSAASKYFRALFESKFEDDQKSEFIIAEADGVTLKTIIDFCYSGKIEINDDNVKQILAIASSLELVRIEEKCAEFWSGSLSLVNCIEIFPEADRYSLADLRVESLDFICENFESLSTSELVKIDKLFMAELLQNEYIWAREDLIFLRMAEWINHESTRSQYAAEMMGLIHMDRITQPFLCETIQSFAEKFNCMNLVHDEYSRRVRNTDNRTNLLRCDVENPKSIFALSCESGIINVAKYFPTANRWDFFRNIPIAGLTTTRTSFGVMFANDLIFLIGGQENGSYITKIDTYDLDKMELLTRANLLENRSHVMPIMFNDDMFIFGGFNGAAMHTCESLSLETMEVTTVASMQFGRYNYAGAILDEEIYIAGGQTAENTLLNSVECYDPEIDQWTRVADMHNARANFALVSLNGRLWAIGDHKTVEVYSPRRNVWFGTGSFNGSDTVIRAVYSQNEIYVLLQGGRFGKLTMNDLGYVFSPLRDSSLSSDATRHLFLS